MGKLAVVAVGGNSLIKDKAHQDVRSQYLAAQETSVHIAAMRAGDMGAGFGAGAFADKAGSKAAPALDRVTASCTGVIPRLALNANTAGASSGRT